MPETKPDEPDVEALESAAQREVLIRAALLQGVMRDYPNDGERQQATLDPAYAKIAALADAARRFKRERDRAREQVASMKRMYA